MTVINGTVIILLTGIKGLNREGGWGEGQSFSSFLSQLANVKNSPCSHGAELLWKNLGERFLQLIYPFFSFCLCNPL